MRIPVITTLPSQEPLQESASRARNNPIGIPEGVNYPSQFEIDRTFSAVPVGSANAGLESLQSVDPSNSAQFAVSGTIEANSIDEVPTELDGQPMFANPEIMPFITCGGDQAVGDHTDVESLLNITSLHNRGLDGEEVAVAIMDTGVNIPHLQAKLGTVPRFDAVNSWMPAGVIGTPGQMPVDHGTMCAYDALIAAPKATLLDFPILSGRASGGSAMGAHLSIALQGFAKLLAFWAVAFAPGGANRYKALVVNNSWGMYHPSWDFPIGHPGRYADNPNHPFNVIVSTLARSNADILFAAGNCGADCPDNRCQNVVTDTISGANALPEVLCVSGCNIHDQRVGYSSQGPAIAGMDHSKPDLTAYTHFKGSEAFGTGTPDSGTSAACPVAAGCVAALRTKADTISFPPAALFSQLEFSCKQLQGAPGWNKDTGHGIINPDAAAQSIGI